MLKEHIFVSVLGYKSRLGEHLYAWSAGLYRKATSAYMRMD